MALTLLLGGARSGKSSLASRLASARGGPVVVVATGEPGDEEMAARIERHRRQRPTAWTTVEEPRALADAVTAAAPASCMIVDCLTLWVNNVFDRADDEILEEAARAAKAATARPGPTIAVTNEVGGGIVPADPASRRYRDLLGAVNQLWADTADRTLLVVAGRALPLHEAAEVADEL